MEPENVKLPPILGWVGGKSKLKNTILDHVPNGHTVYVEPFVGGGSLFFAKDKKPKMVINDKNKELVKFYKVMREKGCQLFNTCQLPQNEKQFYAIKDKGDKRNTCDFLGLVKQSYGCKQDNANIKNNRTLKNSNVAKRCADYERLLKKTVILNRDFADVIQKYDSKNTFFYVDPPYPNTHRYHLPELPAERVKEVLGGVKGKWLLSYSDTPEIRKLFRDYHIKKVKTKYTMQEATQKANGQEIHPKEVSELLIANYDLNDRSLGNPRPRNKMSMLPDVSNPHDNTVAKVGVGAMVVSVGAAMALKDPKNPVGWIAFGTGLMIAGS